MQLIKSFLLVVIMLLFSQVATASDRIVVKKGILDLREVNNEDLKEIKLAGEWEFYWNQLLTSSDFNDNRNDSLVFVRVPAVWNSYTVDGENLPGKGAATYRMRILFDSIRPQMAFKFGSIGTAFSLFIDGSEIRNAGKVSLKEDDAMPGYHPGVVVFTPHSDTVEVIFQVSNYHYSKGGLWNNYNKLGSAKHILKSWNRDIQFSILLIGCIMIFAIYHLGLYLLNRNFGYTLYFSLFCFVIVVRTLVVNEIYLLDLYPDFNWQILVKIEYFSLLAGTMAFSGFIYKFFIEEYSVKNLKFILALSSIFGLIILFTSPVFFTKYLVVYQLNILLAAIFVIIAVVKALIAKKPTAIITLIGFIILILAIINDILYTQKLINTMYMTSFGFILFIFSQAHMLSARFSALFVQKESLAHSLEAANQNLERLVEKRTSRIQEQNALLTEQNDEIKTQRDNLQLKNEIVYKQKKLITSSIEYASRIQSAVIDTSSDIKSVAPDNFILFHPKDIVSGDFYWFKEVVIKDKEFKIVAVVDCTGHGVPGAFMSILGALFLNKIAGDFIDKPVASEILNKMRIEVKNLLHQNEGGNMIKDGMDMALAIMDYDSMQMQFAGAHNPIYIIRNINNSPSTKIEEFKGDKMPIGTYVKEKDTFTNHTIDIKVGDLIYMFSDGYYDQFGGKRGEKLKRKTFRKILLDNAHLSLSQQKLVLDQSLFKWRGDYDQIDDITVVGIRI